MIQEKQAVYNGIAMRLQAQNPAVYSLFQGDQWTTRLEIGFTALFAAVAAGLLVLLIALTLIILKLGFLLLLVAGPFFLIVGVHPGFGRVVAIRWFEMLVGVLLKQVAVALVLSILLYCYSLIMSTTDQELPWALKIMMISLVTVAVFIYRKPFQHLFSSVGYGMLGANERAETTWRESAFGFRRVIGHRGGHRRARRWRGSARPAGRAGPRPRRRRRRDRGPAPAEGASAPPPRTGCPGCRRPTATRPRGSGRPPGSAPGARRRRCRCRPTAPRRPQRRFGGLGQGRRPDGGRRARSRAAAGPHTGPMPAAPTPAAAADAGRAEAPGATRPRATRTASTPPAPTQSTPPPAPPFWSRSRRRPQ